MQYVIVAILVLAALALVILPLVRAPRGVGAGDIDTPDAQPALEEPAPREQPSPRPAAPVSAPLPLGEGGTEELPQAAPPPAAPARPLGAAAADAATEQEILRFREALRARTICPACSTANPPGSKFCKECGEALVVVGAKGAASRAGE